MGRPATLTWQQHPVIQSERTYRQHALSTRDCSSQAQVPSGAGVTTTSAVLPACPSVSHQPIVLCQLSRAGVNTSKATSALVELRRMLLMTGGHSKRAVQCLQPNGQAVAASNCRSLPPGSNISCNAEACSFCQGNLCSGQGTCRDGACQCSPGHRGQYCEVC